MKKFVALLLVWLVAVCPVPGNPVVAMSIVSPGRVTTALLAGLKSR